MDDINIAQEVGKLTGKIDTFVTVQMDYNNRVTNLLEKHETKDENAHKEILGDINSLKTSRKVQRAIIATSAVSTTGAAAKMGWLGKLLTAVSTIAMGQP